MCIQVEWVEEKENQESGKLTQVNRTLNSKCTYAQNCFSSFKIFLFVFPFERKTTSLKFAELLK